MRLLPTGGSFRLEEVQSSPFPPYTILSHTWGIPEDEVIFQDLTTSLQHTRSKAGFSKIQGACAKAHKDLFNWIWIDTCCIDKTNLIELSEAINSMYLGYRV
ncbi:hypothetical protein QBC47DRAFT_396320 [Echria macrotheca]|uniref:Heterokaryon incompatibility domain-containing protein n=1 Tax=Echria macrotheca TaxID=438768 RepID=A0AAJ0BLU4_9PEZI|nr:hypothetical protein QBC47DRAFT_396320 [Echria macrotheca]